ncbi:MAG: hypothetical protein MJZ23_05735 [Paludibacteraceae bacterium]|nr:hypothetical protein [Paludibacteraceae bacterium]
MWKDFFYFTKSEQRGIVVLLVMLALLACVRLLLPHLQEGVEESPLTQQQLEQLKALEQQMSLVHANELPQGKVDPTRLDSSGFVKVGFTAQQAHELMELKRKYDKDNFYLHFMDYAIRINPEWINHIKQ